MSLETRSRGTQTRPFLASGDLQSVVCACASGGYKSKQPALLAHFQVHALVRSEVPPGTAIAL